MKAVERERRTRTVADEPLEAEAVVSLDADRGDVEDGRIGGERHGLLDLLEPHLNVTDRFRGPGTRGVQGGADPA
jgi:hypothetical protein